MERIQRRRNGLPPSDIPLVIAAKIENALRLTAVDRKALRLRLSIGMALADARARVPALDVVDADEHADKALLESIADWCDRYTPFVALDMPHGLLLDITGCAHLFGSERALCKSLEAALVRQGFSVCLGLAGTAVAARALAHYASGTIAPPGEEAKTVAPLPVEALHLETLATHVLKRAGLKTIGHVATRQRGELTARFGAEMVAILDRALGQEEKPISPRRRLPDYMAEHRFAEPVVTEDVIVSSIRSLAETLCAVLCERGEGARLLEASFFRADGAVSHIAVETAKPIRDAAMIARLFRERLDALTDPIDPGFGFDLIRLGALRAERAEAQAISLDANDDDAREVGFLADRLAARFGSHRVLRFFPQDTHIPEAAGVLVPARAVPETKLGWETIRSEGEAPRRPLRLFEKPEPVEVLAEVPDGPPLRFRWRRVQHAVTLAEGPERIAMEWWRHQSAMPTRDYFRVEDQEGRRFWLYRDGLFARETHHPRWYMHGVFA